MESRIIRGRVLSNAGHASLLDGRFDTAVSAYAHGSASINSIICALKLGNRDQVKSEFARFFSSNNPTPSPESLALALSVISESHDLDMNWLEDLLRKSGNQALIDLLQAELAFDHFIEDDRVSVDALRRTNEVLNSSKNLCVLNNQKVDIEKNRFCEQSLVNYAVTTDSLSHDDRMSKYIEAARLSPDCWEARFNAGLLCSSTDLGEATTWFESIHGGLAKALGKLQIAQIYETQGNYVGAISIYTELVADEYRNDANVVERIGILYSEKLDNQVRAFEYMIEADSIDPGRETVLIWLADYYYTRKAFKEALSYFDRLHALTNRGEYELKIIECKKFIL